MKVVLAKSQNNGKRSSNQTQRRMLFVPDFRNQKSSPYLGRMRREYSARRETIVNVHRSHVNGKNNLYKKCSIQRNKESQAHTSQQ